MLSIAAAERCKQLLSEHFSESTGDHSSQRTDSKDVMVQQEGQLLPLQHAEPSKFLSFIANNMHHSTFVPLVIIQVLQDINLGLGGVICVIWVLLALLVGWLLFRKGYIKASTTELTNSAGFVPSLAARCQRQGMLEHLHVSCVDFV